jgi:hypothetical protein
MDLVTAVVVVMIRRLHYMAISVIERDVMTTDEGI